MTSSFRFGTVGSPISSPKRPGGSVGAVMHTRALGLGAMELGWVRSVRVSEATCEAIKLAGEENDVLLSVHAPYYININAEEDEWPKSRQRLMDAAHFGNLAGATEIIFHPGSYFGAPPEDVLPNAIKRLAGCVEELRDAGNPVTLRPETMGKSAMLGSLADTLEISRQIPGVQPCLDFAHLHARPGDGTMNSYDEWCQVLEEYGRLLGEDSLKTLSCHLSGIEYTEKGEKNHLPIADSDFNLEALFEALCEFGAAGRILCESPVMEEDALVFQETWAKISGER
ncbi:MAG: TIM barrel protein [Anaerolineales bacterium]|nr:TIM barrel protein [Anaerolineales bacterium]